MLFPIFLTALTSTRRRHESLSKFNNCNLSWNLVIDQYHCWKFNFIYIWL